MYSFFARSLRSDFEFAKFLAGDSSWNILRLFLLAPPRSCADATSSSHLLEQLDRQFFLLSESSAPRTKIDTAPKNTAPIAGLRMFAAFFNFYYYYVPSRGNGP
jgi:hypothetical protein